jgi:L-ascorbate metabolism protein UlaG (beta-lactamase superfamily)
MPIGCPCYLWSSAKTTERDGMRIQWYGQSAFALSGDDVSVFIDPFGDMSELASSRGMQFDYPPIENATADLLLGAWVSNRARSVRCV